MTPTLIGASAARPGAPGSAAGRGSAAIRRAAGRRAMRSATRVMAGCLVRWEGGVRSDCCASDRAMIGMGALKASTQPPVDVQVTGWLGQETGQSGGVPDRLHAVV